MPPTLVTKDLKIIEEFLDKEEDIITNHFMVMEERVYIDLIKVISILKY